MWGDAGYYVMQCDSLASSIAPYKYRFLPTLVVKAISILCNTSIHRAFLALNIFVTLLTSLLFTNYLRKDLLFTDLVAFIGGMLFVTMVSVTRTLPFPMMEPSSMVFSLLIYIAAVKRNPYMFIFACLGGIMCKEILVVGSLIWLLENRPFVDRGAMFKCVFVSAIPVFGFVLIRVIMGGSPLEVNYGYNVGAGEFPSYGLRLLSVSGILSLLQKTFLAFSFLWLGLVNINKSQFLKRHAIIIPVIILAAFLFSSRIARVLGIFFPVLIPMFLLFFEEPHHKLEAQ
jgi:hypothetical protein